MISLKQLSTGLGGLDKVINGLRVGDNVLWQVDDIQDYRHFVIPFVDNALKSNKKVVYIRFAEHEPLLKPEENIIIYNLDAHIGFEMFSSQVHNIVTKEGEDIYYVFDCLSDLLSAWATDLMIGNFFLIICPYLFELNTIAYFAILRRSHSFKTIARIHEITQVLLEVYNYEGNYYVHPLKAQNRYTPTMFLPHIEDGNLFIPIINSVDATRLFSYISQKGEESTKRKLDYWDRLFLKAEDLFQSSLSIEEKQNMVEQLCYIMIAREKRMLSLAKNYFSLEDLLNIKSRLIGTGFIGGKAVGMLLARNVLLKDRAVDWQHYLEPHDSFYIGSDVFYTYIVQNGWWKLRMEQKTKEGYFKVAALLREKMKNGKFPSEIKEQFQQIIEYFGQSPIIVRSSSLLEDAFGNAFAGKYESIFCVNQGTPDERYMHFEEYVRRVFASAMNEDALTYRLQRGLDKQDEQMALLVQRVSGSHRKHYFFPDLAGVGVSYNTFVWKEGMDPKAGMLRLVLGLGTRAVNRVENDYPRIIALDDPLLRPHAGIEDTRKFSQHEVDVLNIEENILQTVPLTELTKNEDYNIKMELLGTRDYETTQKIRELGLEEREAWVLTFDELLSKSSFASIMQNMLKKLESIYQYPIDIEFTVNFTQKGLININLVQCRPLQTKGSEQKIEIPAHIDNDKILFQSEGSFMGGSILQNIRRIIYVDPESYHRLSLSEKYDIARLVGKLNKTAANRTEMPILLLGPGRWGTTTPSLGVSVRFSEINNIAVIGEISYISGSLMPELSFGTHFFQDLVEADIFYVALFPEKSSVIFNEDVLNRFTNVLEELMPDSGKYKEVVRVYDIDNKALHVAADVMSQKVICFSNESLK
jgi:hypothetical protein